MLDEINRQAETNRLEQHVQDAERRYIASVREKECKVYDAGGKTVMDLETDFNSVLITYTDGTYSYFEAEHDYDGTQLTATTPDERTCVKHNIGDSETLAQLGRARQCLKAHNQKAVYLNTVAQLVRDIGKENILKLLKEAP